MQSFQEEMDVIGNNIANANTTGYKSSRVDLEDSFSQTLRGVQLGSGTTSSIPSVQVGGGVTVGAIDTEFRQGAVTKTNNTGGGREDMAIDGDGFFIVRNPQNNALYATRDGHFQRDTQGFLVSPQGFRLQGYSDAATTVDPSTVNKANVGDLKIDGADRVADLGFKYTLDNYGKILVTPVDTTLKPFVRGQVLLQTFNSQGMLVKEGNNLYSGLLAAAPPNGVEKPGGEPNANGVGKIVAGSLELSNVDLANEFANLITTQRSFQASARIITTSDEMIQETVNLKR